MPSLRQVVVAMAAMALTTTTMADEHKDYCVAKKPGNDAGTTTTHKHHSNPNHKANNNKAKAPIVKQVSAWRSSIESVYGTATGGAAYPTGTSGGHPGYGPGENSGSNGGHGGNGGNGGNGGGHYPGGDNGHYQPGDGNGGHGGNGGGHYPGGGNGHHQPGTTTLVGEPITNPGPTDGNGGYPPPSQPTYGPGPDVSYPPPVEGGSSTMTYPDNGNTDTASATTPTTRTTMITVTRPTTPGTDPVTDPNTDPATEPVPTPIPTPGTTPGTTPVDTPTPDPTPIPTPIPTPDPTPTPTPIPDTCDPEFNHLLNPSFEERLDSGNFAWDSNGAAAWSHYFNLPNEPPLAADGQAYIESFMGAGSYLSFLQRVDNLDPDSQYILSFQYGFGEFNDLGNEGLCAIAVDWNSQSMGTLLLDGAWGPREWQQVTLRVTPDPSGASILALTMFCNLSENVNIMLDDVKLLDSCGVQPPVVVVPTPTPDPLPTEPVDDCAVTATNLFRNPSFEEIGLPYADPWWINVNTPSTVTQVISEPGDPITGFNSDTYLGLTIRNDATVNIYQQFSNLRPAGHYLLTFHYGWGAFKPTAGSCKISSFSLFSGEEGVTTLPMHPDWDSGAWKDAYVMFPNVIRQQDEIFIYVSCEGTDGDVDIIIDDVQMVDTCEHLLPPPPPAITSV